MIRPLKPDLEMMGEKRRAEVAGGGIAGLTAAAALARAGWQVRVHERGGELREIGAGIFVWENGLRALEEIGAFDEATADGEFERNWELRDERRRLIQSSWMLAGARLYTVLRPVLHRALANAAVRHGVEIRCSSTVSYATSDGEVFFEDGSSTQADLVVGADGVHSRIRDHLQLAQAVRDLEDGCGRHLIERSRADPKGAAHEYWRGGRRVGIVPCSPERVYIYLCCPAKDREGRAKPLDRASWLESFPHLGDVIERIPDEGRWAAFYDVVCHAWSAGRAAIVGDAAHAMSPNLGQGACVAMTNAIALAQALDAYDDVPEALKAWERSERPITDATQRYSGIYGRIGTFWPQWMLDVRSALVWAAGRSVQLQRRANVAAHHYPSIASARPRAPRQSAVLTQQP